MSIRKLNSEIVRHALLPVIIVVAMAMAGCGHKEGAHEHEHGHDHTETGHSHGDDAQSFSGATYKDGEGITLMEQTRKALAIAVAPVQEKALPRELRFALRVFSGTSAAAAEASGVVSTNDAAMLRTGVEATVQSTSGETFKGRIAGMERSALPQEREVVVSFNAPGGKVQFGSVLTATIKLAGEEAAAAVPRSAVVRGVEGPFVYTVNGSAYLRTPVELGVEAGDFVQVREGLLPGDEVVSQGAQDLWLIELRAVKGGQGCCPAPPAKNKT